MSTQTNLRQRISAEIIEGIKIGNPIWKRPLASADPGLPANVVSRRAYSGLNIFAPWAAGQERGFTSRYWATYQQWAILGGQVRRPADIPSGGWGCRIVYRREVTKARDTDDGELEDRYKLMRSYVVFNLDQVGGAALEHLRS